MAFPIVLIVALFLGIIVTGSVRVVERDPLAPRAPRRLRREILGVGLIVAIAAMAIVIRTQLGANSRVGSVLGGILCLLVAGLLAGTYFLPNGTAIFGMLDTLAEHIPRRGGTADRADLLFGSVVLSVVGLWFLIGWPA